MSKKTRENINLSGTIGASFGAGKSVATRGNRKVDKLLAHVKTMSSGKSGVISGDENSYLNTLSASALRKDARSVDNMRGTKQSMAIDKIAGDHYANRPVPKSTGKKPAAKKAKK